MIELRKSSERGKTKIDWLESCHSFSFGEYYDPLNMNFGPLRVMNDDIIQPGAGFPTHPHRDMEIVTIVFEGAVAHKDSSGGDGIITVNEVQRMTAGSGIRHSEFNASDTEVLKLLQVWLIPNKRELEPSYDQKKFSHQEKNNRLLKIVSGNEVEGILFINQDADIYLSDLETGNEIKHVLKQGRGLYLHLIEGAISAGGNILKPGDAVKITDEESLIFSAAVDSKLILFDLNMNF